MQLSKLIGLYSRMSDGDPLFLNRAVMFPCFQIEGNVSVASDLLNSLVRGSFMITAVNLSILFGRLSGPHDLFIFSELS